MTTLDARKAIDAIKAGVLPRIQPTKEENQIIRQIYKSLEKNLLQIAKKLNVTPKFIQNHGSTGIKKTHLHGTSDLDIFIGLNPREYSIIELPPKKRKESLKKLFHSYVKEWFIPAAQAAGYTSFQISYAEHPYLIISYNSHEIDIVGCFDLDYDYLLTNGPITAVDRTPWHSKIIAEKLTSAQKQDVRLLKAFFQSNFVYGDKATLGRFGFTGFSSEVLILFYKNIENVFSHFKELNKTALDFFDRSTKPLRENKRFKDDFLIIIDPVDMNRNLASSISKRAYDYALFQIERFLNNPSADYFLKKPPPLPSPKLLTQLSPNLVIVEFISDGTVHYSELRDKITSACEKLRKLLEKEETGEDRFGRTVFEVYFEENIYVAVFYCENSSISPTYLRKGPSIKRAANVKQFRAKHPDAFVKNGFICTNLKREFQIPLLLISHFFQTYKTIKGLTLSKVSQEASSPVAQRALALMISCVLPLYKVVA